MNQFPANKIQNVVYSATHGHPPWDERILPLVDVQSMDGSEVRFTLVGSQKSIWSKREKFVSQLKLARRCLPNKNKEKPEDHFNRLLLSFNSYIPDIIKIDPVNPISKHVLIDDWNLISIMWEEAERYYAYRWVTTV